MAAVQIFGLDDSAHRNVEDQRRIVRIPDVTDREAGYIGASDIAGRPRRERPTIGIDTKRPSFPVGTATPFDGDEHVLAVRCLNSATPTAFRDRELFLENTLDFHEVIGCAVDD